MRHGPAEVLAALGRGETVDPAAYYFRTVPRFEAADTALATVREYLDENPSPIRVIMCTYDALATMIMTDAMKALRFGPS